MPVSHGQMRIQPVFDQQSDEYLVMVVGWDGPRRIHALLIHVELREGKVWVQRDGTEYGVAKRLVDEGIPAEYIVLGWIDSQPVTADLALAA